MPPRNLARGMRKGSRPPASLSMTPRGQVRDFRGRFAGGGVTWYGLEASQKYLEDVQRRTQAGAQRAAQRLVEEAVVWMKANAPWQDRTGNARRGLKGQVHFNEQADGNQAAVRIYLGHTEEYGVHLELGMGGRFQIIRPAMQRVAQKLPESVVREAGL